jgi:hypothetical protein
MLQHTLLRAGFVAAEKHYIMAQSRLAGRVLARAVDAAQTFQSESAARRYTGRRLSEVMKKLLRFHAIVTMPRSIR